MVKNRLFLLFLLLASSLYGQEDTSSISLLFAGDIMGHGPQINAAWNPLTKQYEYDSCFLFVASYIDAADLAIGNLELPLAGPPYSGYPQFSSPDALAVALKKAGFDILVTANNHAADRGSQGLSRTLTVLDSLGIKHTGTFRDQVERDSVYPFFIECKGMRIALLNYTYGTNGMPVPEPYIVNLIDTSLISRDIMMTQQLHPDFILVVMHWGNEYERTPDIVQQNLAKFILGKGASAIIGSHPHVIQPIVWMPDLSGDSTRLHPVVWSMGNFISNQRDRYRNGGIMVRIELKKDTACSIRNLSWIPVYVNRRRETTGQRYFLLPASTWIEGNISFRISKEEEDSLRQFYNDTREHLENIPEYKPEGELAK